MTTQTRNSIHFNVSKSHGWKDLFVVASLRHRPRRLRRPDLLDSEALLRLAADGGGFRDRLHERLAISGGQPHGGR